MNVLYCIFCIDIFIWMETFTNGFLLQPLFVLLCFYPGDAGRGDVMNVCFGEIAFFGCCFYREQITVGTADDEIQAKRKKSINC